METLLFLAVQTFLDGADTLVKSVADDVIDSDIFHTRAARYLKEGAPSMVKIHEIKTCPCPPQCG